MISCATHLITLHLKHDLGTPSPIFKKLANRIPLAACQRGHCTCTVVHTFLWWFLMRIEVFDVDEKRAALYIWCSSKMFPKSSAVPSLPTPSPHTLHRPCPAVLLIHYFAILSCDTCILDINFIEKFLLIEYQFHAFAQIEENLSTWLVVDQFGDFLLWALAKFWCGPTYALSP